MARRAPSLLTTGQAARLCDVTPDTVLKWIRKGRLRGVRTAGGHWRVHLRDLEPHIPPGGAEPWSGATPECSPPRLPCWEYLSDNGVVAEKCTRCVVYQVRGTQCLQMADLETEAGHARQFCRNSCEDCVYYRRVLGLPTNVLVITSDEALLERLSSEEDERLALRFARNAYEASAVVQSFQAAFVVVDQELLTAGEGGLLGSLAADPRLPGVKIVVCMRQGAAAALREDGHKTPVFSVIEKPFGPQRIASVVDSFPIERSTRPDLSVGV